MTFVWAFLGFLLLVVWVVSVADIIRRPLDRQHTAAWLLIVVLLPFVGAIAYWVTRKPTEAEVRATADAQQSMRDEARHRPVSGI